MRLDKNYKVRVTPEQSREIQELVFGLGGKWNGGTDWVVNEISPVLYVTSGLVMTCDSKVQEYFGYASSENTEILATELIAKLEQLTKNDKTIKLDDFLKCRKVKCVKGYGRHLTVGETYHVLGLSVPNNLVQVENDNGFITEYDFEKFEPVLDSAENPLQNAELTPDFEAVEPVLANNSINIQDIGTNILDTNASIKDTPKFQVRNKVYVGLTGKIVQVTEIIDDDVVSVANKINEVRAGISYICHATQENYERLQATFPHIDFEQPPKKLTGSDLCRAMLEKGWNLVPCVVSDTSDNEALLNDDCQLIDEWYNGYFECNDNRFKYAVPFDQRTGEPLTEAVLDE